VEEIERLAEIEREYESVLERLSEPISPRTARLSLDLSRRHKSLEATVQTIRAMRGALDDVVAATRMLDGAPPKKRNWRAPSSLRPKSDVASSTRDCATLLVPSDRTTVAT